MEINALYLRYSLAPIAQLFADQVCAGKPFGLLWAMEH